MFITRTQLYPPLRKQVGRPKNEESIPIVDSLLLIRNNFEIVIPKPIDKGNTNPRPRLDETGVGILTKAGKPNNKPNNKPDNESMPEPSNKELPDVPDLIISSEKRKEYDEEDDRAVKRLRALLA